MKNTISKYFFGLGILCFCSINGASIHTSNKILTQIGETSISVLDVKKEMDRQIYINDKKIFNDAQILGAYYHQNWKPTLAKILHNELLFLESKRMKYSIPTHEISKQLKQLYGDNEISLLKFLSISPETAKNHAEKEVISSHISWFNIWSKAMMKATPKEIRKEYEEYAINQKKKSKWTYQAIYVKGNNQQIVDDALSDIDILLKKEKFSNLSAIIDRLTVDKNTLKIGVSKDITLHAYQLSPTLLSSLESIEEGSFSEPITANKSNTYTGKILHLKEIKNEPIEELSTMNEKIKNQLVNQIGQHIAEDYYTKLYANYDLQGLYGDKLNKSSFQPFTLENE